MMQMSSFFWSICFFQKFRSVYRIQGFFKELAEQVKQVLHKISETANLLVMERLPKQSVKVRCGYPMVGFGLVGKLKQSVPVTTIVGYFFRFSVTYFSVKIAFFWSSGATLLHIYSTFFSKKFLFQNMFKKMKFPLKFFVIFFSIFFRIFFVMSIFIILSQIWTFFF